MPSRENDYLFRESDLSTFLREQQEATRIEIDRMTSDYILKVSLDDLTAHLSDKFHLEPVLLVHANIHIGDSGDTKVDMSGNPRYATWHQGPVLVPATFATFIVPFTGNDVFFRLRPSSFNFMPPAGKIIRGELHLRYTTMDHNQAAMRAAFDSDLKNVEQYLSWGAGEIHQHNQSNSRRIREQLEFRKAKFLKDKGMVEALGFPIKPRDGSAQTYVAPVSRKKLPIQKPVATPGMFAPEPSLAMEQYEHILTVISSMVQVMERSPQAFAKMGEEALRTQILVPLNGHYEGQATGETFNYEGKTDILIRSEGRNIFIGECKFWKGAESFKDTIDQLLGYAAWRDTKTAIVLFNRNKNTSAVVTQIPDLLKQHSNFKRELTGFKHESGFRCILHHRDDKNRELTLTVLVFDVPA